MLRLRLFFMQKPDKDSKPLRDGIVDLETGVIDLASAPELKGQSLFRDNYVGVVRARHPLSRSTITPEKYAAGIPLAPHWSSVIAGAVQEIAS
jgi:DNA-binding transcriptional LysR family regulator